MPSEIDLPSPSRPALSRCEPPEAPVPAPILERATANGFHVACYALPLSAVPADFFADPDGSWTFEALATAAGFAVDAGVAIGALSRAFDGHPAGAAVVTLNAEARPYVAIVECPIAFSCAEPCETIASSAA